MISDPQRRIRELFCDALERPEPERQAFVLSETTDDPDLRSAVLGMLGREAMLGSFMGTLPALEVETRTPRQSFADGEVVASRYRIERLIKCGGMGEVYQAQDTRLDRRVALKTILPDIAGDPSVMTRFRREVLLASTVTHKNVCRVYDIGEQPEQSGNVVAFLTMEFLPGETLRERLKRTGPLQLSAALPIVRQLADALDAAHTAGVVHRDFKPANVMLVANPDGYERAVVTDFGLARTTAIPWTDDNLTRSGQVLGTPEYMSPEQWSGQSIGPAADLFAFGAVIREMTDRGAAELSPEEGHWKSIVERCLARDPADRPSSAGEVVQLLEHVPKATRRPAVSRSAFVMLVAGFAVLVLLLALLFYRLRFPDQGVAVNDRQRIAVLPLTADASMEAFARGLTEAVTARLGQYRSPSRTLFIVPASEVQRERVRDVAQARSRFSANFVIASTLQSNKGRLRLTLALIDAAEMRQIESALVEGTTGEAFALQDAAVTRIATMLNLDVRPEAARDLNQFSPVVPGTYELYLQGRGYLRRNDTPKDVDSAIEVLERARSLDSSYALARAALGEAYWRRWERSGNRIWAEAALREASDALRLQPRLPEAHTAMGVIYSGTGQDSAAFDRFEEAVRVQPRSVDSLIALGRARARAKHFDTAEAAFRKALELEPQDWRGYRELGLLQYNRCPRNLTAAIHHFQKVVELTPDNPGAYNNLGAFYAQSGDYTRAEAMIRKALQLDPKWSGALTNLGKVLFEQGRYPEAVAWWEKAVADEKEKTNVRLWGNLAASYAKVGKPQQSRASYQHAVRLLTDRLKVNSGDSELYSFRAHFLTPLGETEKALADLAKSELTVRNAATLERDADTLHELGQDTRALKVLQQAVKVGCADDLNKNERLRPLIARFAEEGGPRLVKR